MCVALGVVLLHALGWTVCVRQMELITRKKICANLMYIPKCYKVWCSTGQWIRWWHTLLYFTTHATNLRNDFLELRHCDTLETLCVHECNDTCTCVCVSACDRTSVLGWWSHRISILYMCECGWQWCHVVCVSVYITVLPWEGKLGFVLSFLCVWVLYGWVKLIGFNKRASVFQGLKAVCWSHWPGVYDRPF